MCAAKFQPWSLRAATLGWVLTAGGAVLAEQAIEPLSESRSILVQETLEPVPDGLATEPQRRELPQPLLPQPAARATPPASLSDNVRDASAEGASANTSNHEAEDGAGGGPVSAAVPLAVPSDAAAVSPASGETQPAAPHSVGTLDHIGPLAAFAAGSVDADQPRPGQAISFNSVQPGTSTADEVRARWGEPLREESLDAEGDEQVWYYRLPGVRQADVVVTQGVVSSLVLHLEEPVSLDELAEQTGYELSRAVRILDEFGELLGMGFPNHGVLCGFQDTELQLVTDVVAEPLSAELFRLRVEQRTDGAYETDLADIEVALEIDPRDPEAHWRKSELMSLDREYASALAHVQKALALDPQNSLYQLTQARLWAETGDVQRALLATAKIAEEGTELTSVRALAYQQWGDLMLLADNHDVEVAIAKHLQAIDLAATLIEAKRESHRRLAKRVLVNSHLAVAIDVALGNYQKKDQVVPKWLTQATELAEDVIANDQGDETLKLHVYRTTLQAMAAIGSTMDPSLAADEAISAARHLIAGSDDRIFRRRVETLLAETLFHGARIERLRGKSDACQSYLNNALALLEQHDVTWLSSHERYLLGQVQFLTGSLAAVVDGDHQEARGWFDLAAPLLRDRRYATPAHDVVNYGELFVSMGVSYWETGQKRTAIELTEEGVAELERAVEAGLAAEQQLSVPYGNLAAMHSLQGNPSAAERFSQMAARLQGRSQQR